MDLGILMLPVVSSSVSIQLIPAEQQRSSTTVPAEQLGKKHRGMLEHKKRQCLSSYFSSQNRGIQGKRKKSTIACTGSTSPRVVSLRVSLLYSETCPMFPGQGMSKKGEASWTQELKYITLTKYSKNS